MDQEYYLELSENPVQFENASSVNNVFFDEANKQVFAVRSGGATGVVVKGPEDKSPIAFRMDDKGEVKCIKFSLGNKILAVQRTPKSVDFTNFIPDFPHLEFSHECKTKNANVLGFCWTNWNEIVFVTDQGIEYYQVLPDKRSLKMLKSQSINVNWYIYCPETAVLLLSTTVQGNVLQPFAFKNGTMSKMPKFEIELPMVPKPAKISLSERDIAVSTIYGQLYVMYLKHQSRSTNSSGAEVVLYHLPREGAFKKTHILKLNTTGKFALNVVDNLVVVHHQSSQTSIIFDIKLREPDCAVNVHQPVLPARSIHPYKIPLTGYLWYLQVKLQPTVNLLQDKGKLMDFLLRRRDCKMVILSVCSQMLDGGEKGNLPVIATVFDKLNQVYKEYLEAEQAYTVALESGPSRFSSSYKRPVRTQAVIDQSDMYTHVLSAFTENKDVSHKFIIAVVMEYIRSLNQFQITVQHYLYELVIKTLVQHNLFYMLHQFLQYHVLSDSKPLACLLLSLESTYPPAHQLSLDMLKRLSTANDEIVEVLLSKQQVLGALRFVRSVGGHDNVSARKFLDAARQTEDTMLFYTIFRFFEQRNLRLRGNPAFNPGEHCEEHNSYFKEVFGEQTLMKSAAV
uniref:Regulator of MON1-CCZ1 n=1 Tax=Astyanax mexicanus TaxID=7994 RepID=W5L9D5_ASTMX